MALATVGEDGAPDVRYVLVRGVDERGLAFYTNLTSVEGRAAAARTRSPRPPSAGSSCTVRCACAGAWSA